MWSAVLVGTALLFVLMKNLDEVVKWTSVLGFFVALISLLLSLTPRAQRPAPGLTPQLDQAAEDLALSVRGQWREEERLRRLHDPFPLAVRWTAAEEAVADHWAGLSGRSATAATVNPDGRLEQVADVFRRIPSGRLVVLGKPGAGKTVLTLRLTLDLLRSRQPQDPVPAIFPLLSWHPGQQSLHTWMSERLATDYPALGAPAPSGSTWAWELVRAGRLLPVLDGLDEIAEPLRADAMRRLNAALDRDTPVVLTCRTDEYRDTVRAAGVFTAAAVVELQGLSLDDLEDYLPRTARRMPRQGTGAPTTKWQPALEYLREHPDRPAARTVMTVLSTPLMTSLARAAYSDTRADPLDLFDGRFADPAALEEHLLDAFVPATFSSPYSDSYSYQRAASDSSPGPAQLRCTPEQAQAWLGWLARHLVRLDTHDLAWWQMPRGVPRLTRGLWAGCLAGLVCGLVGHLAAGPAAGLAYGIAYGTTVAIAYGLGRQRGPAHVELRFRGTAMPFLRRFTVGLATGLVLGLGFDFQGGAMIVGQLAFGLAFGLHVWLNTPADAARVSSPSVALRQDRTATLAFGLSYAISLGFAYGASFFADDLAAGFAVPLALGLSFSPTYGIAGAAAGAVAGGIAYGRVGVPAYLVGGTVSGGVLLPPMHRLGFGVVLGLLFGLSVGLQSMMSRAWGSLVFSRMWLALHGHQPWRLMRFLADAHRRGVLRQAGGVYQFRHARLRDHLARSTGPRQARRHTRG
ncbi:transcriptional regulator [Streptomyces sp. NBRC 110611]|uniref:NACHT domain-containing protein n=1 Tax=Streptomyces sp. NBRC 110611 TaxID=1621259 RepID=UPI00082F57CC|nr:NACHT domain-containing protein [Streptomyces sp. NBRC 110611]GAU70300.1 transcriptional regulator [Streptomyces sp. NBRC 110611]